MVKHADAQGLTLDQAGGSSTTSPEVTSPQMRQLLPLIMQQLQNNPEVMSQFGLGGLSGMQGLAEGGGASIPGAAANGNINNIPGLNEAIAKALAEKNTNTSADTNANAGAGSVPSGIPEQVALYREQFHPIDINQDGRIDADEAASYASWMFRRRDINGDNVLQIREFSAVEKLPGSPEANRQRLRTESRRLEMLFPKFDTNGDKMVSKDEFLEQARIAFDEKRGTDPDLDPFAFQTVLPF